MWVMEGMALMVAFDRSRIWAIFIVCLSGSLKGLCAKLRHAAARTGVTLGTTFHTVISKHWSAQMDQIQMGSFVILEELCLYIVHLAGAWKETWVAGPGSLTQLSQVAAKQNP